MRRNPVRRFRPSVFEAEEKRLLRIRFANIAFATAFPLIDGASGLSETVNFTSAGVFYPGLGNFLSSRSLLEALERRSILDEFFEEFLPARPEEDYLFAGISVPFASQCEPALRIARAIKRVRLGLHVCPGGNFVGFHLQHAGNPDLFRHVDGMVAGDGEGPLEAMLLASGAGGIAPERIPGMTWLEGETIRSNPLPPPTPLVGIPVPADVFPHGAYLAGPDDPFHRLSLSRGCSWGRCDFCNTGGTGSSRGRGFQAPRPSAA